MTRGRVHRFPPEAVQAVKERQLDVIIRFGFNILRGEVLTSAKYGIWSYHHGDNHYYRGGPPCFWEVYERNQLTGVILQVLTEELDNGKVLSKGMFATTKGVSHARNHAAPYWGASTFLIQNLWELHQGGWSYLEQRMFPPAPYLGRKKLYVKPTNIEMLQWGPVVLGELWRHLTKGSVVEHWRIAIRVAEKSIPDSDANPDLGGFR